MRDVLANKDNETVESVREATNNLQKAAMKLFEFAYKNKMCKIHNCLQHL